MTKPTTTSQTKLFDASLVSQVGSNGTVFKDPAFVSNKTAPVHRWVPWIAGFSREFVQSAIGRHLRKRGTVLDPFAGVGTTLVEAILAGHDAVGFEINPYAALACRTKLKAYKLPQSQIRNAINGFQDFYKRAQRATYNPRSAPPPGFKTRATFYSPKVMHKVLTVHDYINKQPDGVLSSLFRLAFGATMVTYSNYSYEPSLGRRATAGKSDVYDFPVGEVIADKLFDMAHDIEWMQERMNGKRPTATVYEDSFFSSRERLHANSVDLLVTSPPYLNNYHYNRNTRPHLYWLSLAKSPADFDRLENDNFGKFWQTVRNVPSVQLDTHINDEEIDACLNEIRAKSPDRGIYGGPGWANYAVSYFNDCYRFAITARRALKPRGTALVVVGNSILQGVLVPTDRFLAKIAQPIGLELVDIHIPRSTRVGNSIIQSSVRVEKAKQSHQLYEAVVELRKR